MNITEKYFDYLKNTFMETIESEEQTISQAAELVTHSLADGGRFYVFGSGHSHMIAEEIYTRAGGLALVNAILLPELMLHEMPTKSTYLERLEGYAEGILELYKVKSNDTLMVISNSGRNNVPVEMSLKAKENGTNVIAMTSLKHSKDVNSRHKSGRNIYEIADVTIDNHAQKGDADFYIPDVDKPVGPVSNFTGIALAQALMVTVIDKLKEQEIEIPIFKSSNLDGADNYNQELFDKYYGYWK